MTLQLQVALAEPDSLWLEADAATKTQIQYISEPERSSGQLYAATNMAVAAPIFENVTEESSKISWTFAQPEYQAECKTVTEKPAFVWHEAALNLEVAGAVFKGSQAKFGPVSLTLQAGDFLVVSGQTEAARTLFSRLLIGLAHPTQGSVAINGQDLVNVSHSDLAHWRQLRVNFVSNHTPLWGMLTVLDNLLLPSYNQQNITIIQHEAEAIKLLKLCGLDSYRDCLASELTPEQSKLVAFLRGFIKQPQLFVYDNAHEEFSSEMELLIWKILAHYHQNGVTLVCTATPQQYKSWQAHNYLPSDYRQVAL